MREDINLTEKVVKDIACCNECLDKHSSDRGYLEEVFNKILFGYIDIIENLSDGLNVVSPDCEAAELRDNVAMLLNRLIDFKDSGCDNEKLRERYVSAGKDPFEVRMRFCETREYVSAIDLLTDKEKDDINSKIDEIEAICLSVDTVRHKWNLLRPYVVWCSGKSAGIALKILPLFSTIG